MHPDDKAQFFVKLSCKESLSYMQRCAWLHDEHKPMGERENMFVGRQRPTTDGASHSLPLLFVCLLVVPFGFRIPGSCCGFLFSGSAEVASPASSLASSSSSSSLLPVIHVSGKDVIVIACKFFGNR